MSTAMTEQLSVPMPTVFDAEVIRKCAEAGVPAEYMASCFLTTVEVLTAEIRRVPELLHAFARGRAEHLCFLFNTLKASTSPSLIALLARTEGLGSKPKAAKSDKAEQGAPENAESAKGRAKKAKPAKAAPAAQAIAAVGKRTPVRSTKLAEMVQGYEAPAEADPASSQTAPLEFSQAGLSNGQREALSILQRMQGKTLSRTQRRAVEREIEKAEKKGKLSLAALLKQQASGVVLPG